MADVDRLQSQIAFLLELDKLESILRRMYLPDSGRYENSAEHSWQLAMGAIILAEHSNDPVDILRVLKLVIVHDIVEIDAGDTFCYDTVGLADKAEREQRAADRIFGLLPSDQAAEIHALWEEFETGATAESRFANALDRLMPVLQNCTNAGGSWREHKVSFEQVVDRNAPIDAGSHVLWSHVQGMIEEICAKGWPAS